MKTIYHYPVEPIPLYIDVPLGYRVAMVGDNKMSHSRIWFVVNTANKPIRIQVVAVPTGGSVPAGFDHVGSYMGDNNDVWHIFIKD